MKRLDNSDQGFAILTALFLVLLLSSLFGTYMVVARTELGLVKTSRDSASGFNAAESGLNLRAETIRAIFLDYDVPEGTSPSGIEDCDAGTTGDGDYECETFTFDNGHTSVTYVEEHPDNPFFTVIPPGEAFAGLNTQEYRYTVTSVGRNPDQSNEAILDLTFKNRLVPLFQFAIFFEEDLEFFNGASMSVTGPVHTNGDMYLGTQDGGTTSLDDVTSIAGTFYRGLKSQTSCSGYGGLARALDPSSYVNFNNCSGSRFEISDVDAWNDNILLDVDPVEVPSPEDMDPFGAGEYWQRADLRLVLRLDGSGFPDTTNSPTGVEVVDATGTVMSAETTLLNNSASCPGSVQTNFSAGRTVGTQGPGTGGDQLRLYREYQYDGSTNDFQRTLEVDMQALLTCVGANSSILGGKSLSDDTEQGLVFHFTVSGPLSSASHNNYSVRLRNGATLDATGGTSVQGLTVVSDQGVVIWGNYNSNTTNWKPAAIMADTIWLLSNDWVDADSYQTDRYLRDGNATTVRAGVISGIARTGYANGPAGQDQGYNTNGGGVINVFRFNEWFRVGSSIPDFTYEGSIVSLGAPRRSQSSWGPFTYYSAPNRVWSYETRFNNADDLPPMTPVFVYLRQELFVRNYEL